MNKSRENLTDGLVKHKLHVEIYHLGMHTKGGKSHYTYIWIQ